MNFPDTLSIIRKCRTLTDNCQFPYRFLESTEIWSMSGVNCQIIDWPYLHCGRTLLLAPYTWYWNHDSTQHRDLIYEWGELSSHRYLSASWRCRLATKPDQDQIIFCIWKLATPQVAWNVLFTTTQGNDLKNTTSVFSITKPTSSTSERLKWTANLHVSM